MGNRKAREEKARRAAKKEAKKNPGPGTTARIPDGPPSKSTRAFNNFMARVFFGSLLAGERKAKENARANPPASTAPPVVAGRVENTHQHERQPEPEAA